MTIEFDSENENLGSGTLASVPVVSASVVSSAAQEPDDRYPGTFFRIPGMPMPGTSWSLSE